MKHYILRKYFSLFLKRTLILSAAAIISLPLLSCSFNFNSYFCGKEEITVNLPENVSSCYLFYADENNCRISRKISSNEEINGCLCFKVNRNEPFPVMISRTSTCSKLEQCYGFLYPFTADFQKQDAFSADILLSLYECSTSPAAAVREYLSCFNWNRFIEECRNIETPERLDKENIMKKIAAGTFTKSDLKPAVEN